MGEHSSSTEFSLAGEIQSNCKSRAVRDRYSQKLRDKEKASTIALRVVKNSKFATVD